jgi:colanic acid/amylovoran biosynthesis glycosyltransferase
MSETSTEFPVSASPSGGAAGDIRDTLLVYRHRLVPVSEVSFLSRFYVGFERLSPVWVGCHPDAGLSELTRQPLLLGRAGPLGAVDRALFRQFGIVPPQPDLRAVRPRIVHAHFGRGGALALPISRALQIPLVVTFHGGDATKEKHYRRHLPPQIFERRLAALQREAALFICVSEFVRDRLAARGFPVEKLEVIHQGAEIETRENSEPLETEPYVLFVGRFVEKKGVAYLIEAMRLLETRGNPVGLVLVGHGPLSRELKEQARSLKRISFLGWLPNHEVRHWMRHALAVCVPSVTARAGDSEGLPTVIFEAMAEGVPVVGSRHAGIAEAIEHDRTGLLVSPGHPRSLADALESLIAAPERRRSMGQAARRVAAAQFSALQQSRRLEQALLRVMGDPPR